MQIYCLSKQAVTESYGHWTLHLPVCAKILFYAIPVGERQGFLIHFIYQIQKKSAIVHESETAHKKNQFAK